MSGIMKSSLFFSKKVGSYSDGWGEVVEQDRGWEQAYRDRWAHDKIVRSTHGVNCTGSCSWQVYVKDGIVVWETQETDYPPTPPGVPNHEPRGCPRGASYSWYLYSASRVKHPLIRAELKELWENARKTMKPLEAWASIVEDQQARKSYTSVRGLGGLVRTTWDEALEIIAAANLYTVKKYGPDRISGFSPIPGYSMVSYGAGTRYLSLIGGALLSFYDWYCDLPPSSPQTWGEQTDVPESEAWYYSSYIIVWGTNISMTRTPDAHFLTECRYNGTKVVNVCPDYVEVTKDADWWIHPKQATDAAFAMAVSHVIFKEFHYEHPDPYFTEYCRNLTDFPVLVSMEPREDGRFTAGRYLRACDIGYSADKTNNPEWKTVVWNELDDSLAVPQGSMGYRWGQKEGQDLGKWNLHEVDGESGKSVKPKLTFVKDSDAVIDVCFPYFGGRERDGFPNNAMPSDIMVRKVPVKKVIANGKEIYCATVFDLFGSYLGVDRGLGGECAKSYEDNIPFTPAWQQKITGVEPQYAITLGREFATAASKTKGRACVLMGAGVNQWFQTDNTYRSIINILLMCGTCGVTGGGWCHYVGQEKIRPEAGWSEYSFAKDWEPAARHMNSTSYFYEHTDQWRYERIPLSDMLSPLADTKVYNGTYVDYNVKSELMGWLPSAPQLNVNPTEIASRAAKAGKDPQAYLIEQLKNKSISFSCLDLDAEENWPRNLFIWRSNVLGSSGKGQEYFLKHLLGTQNAVLGQELDGKDPALIPQLQTKRPAPEGKLDLLVNMDFRMSTTSIYSDIVLPAATFYEKNDINTTDMHSFIHPFVKAVQCSWEGRSDWDTFKSIAKKLSEMAAEYPQDFAEVTDVVLTPLGHDSPHELGQALDVKNWYLDECDLIPGKTAPLIHVIPRDYRTIYQKYTSVGPLLSKNGGGNRGIKWDLDPEIEELRQINGTVQEGVAKGRPKMETDINAANFIMRVSPETNGALSYRSWSFVKDQCGVDCSFLSKEHIGDKITFDDLAHRPAKTFTAPDWSGIENSEIPYVAFWQNTNMKLPWRTLTGRQQFYQDHSWMRAFGQQFAQYRAPANQRALKGFENITDNGNKAIVLNFMTAHQKWGIHSTYYDNERMLSLSRGGPVVWMNDIDANNAGIVDNDWIECWNANGAVVGRAIVTSRMPEGLCIMQHATEKTVNTPGSEITGQRGGDHNSPTRVIVNPTHMIGGYAQLSYAFNYYGTIAPNRDDFAWVRKMNKVDWMDEEAPKKGGTL